MPYEKQISQGNNAKRLEIEGRNNRSSFSAGVKGNNKGAEEVDAFNGILKKHRLTNENDKKPSGTMGKDDMLKLLIAQMKNQDLDGMKTETMMAQISQMATVEQMTKVGESAVAIDGKLSVMQGMTMQDRFVSVLDPAAPAGYQEQITRQVIGVAPSKEEGAILTLDDGSKVNLNDVINIAQDPNRQQLTAQVALADYINAAATVEEKEGGCIYHLGKYSISDKKLEENIQKIGARVQAVSRKGQDTVLTLNNGKEYPVNLDGLRALGII